MSRLVLMLCCVNLLLPEPVLWAAQQPEMPAVERLDVALSPQGTLQGALVTPQGTPVDHARVMIVQGPERKIDLATDREGRFESGTLPAGIHVVAAAGCVKVCRVWAPGTAPPTAGRGVLLVADGAAVRGQRDWYQWVSEHYILFVCAVTTAVVVPIAVIDANRRSPASP
ncbi:MAG: carboxypeptidase regulatory-like domain-containing protein [Pirellulales bacterium]|nr:carboxypeptidase regulatory-like domain-containing protein [Pirellulales bacterium]